MRRQQISISRSIAPGFRPAALKFPLPRSAALGCLIAAAMVAIVPTPAPAETSDVVAGEPAENGMPSSNPRVKPLLSGHPNDFVTICVAGCDKPRIVQILPKPRESRVGSMRTTSGNALPAAAYDSIDRDSVLCVAGCSGRPGIVQRMQGLPSQKAPPQPRSEEQGNEPLDRIP
jgi:hypothetical protein